MYLSQKKRDLTSTNEGTPSSSPVKSYRSRADTNKSPAQKPDAKKVNLSFFKL